MRLDDGESFDVTLLAWRPEVAKVVGLTAERAVRVTEAVYAAG